MSSVSQYWADDGELKDVCDFHLKFDVPMRREPTFIKNEHIAFRIKFLQEELDEFREAIANRDMLKAADALVDLQYVLKGTVLMMGLHYVWPALWMEVQEANMRKVRAASAADSKRGSAIDVVKPPGWVGPDHSQYLGNGPWPDDNT